MFAPNAVRHGVFAALRILQFETSKEWLDHLASDEFLSEARLLLLQ